MAMARREARQAITMNDMQHDGLQDWQSDPQLDALLDAALEPEAAPAGMNQRILAASEAALAERAHPVVAGRIGGLGRQAAWSAVAAALLMAGLIGALWFANQNTSVPGGDDFVAIKPTPTDDATRDDLAPRDTPLLTRQELAIELTRLAEAERQADAIDDRIGLLSMQVSWTNSSDLSDPWSNDELMSLDDAIVFEEFEALAQDMEMYF